MQYKENYVLAALALIELKNKLLHLQELGALKRYGGVGLVIWKNYIRPLIINVKLYQFLGIVFIYTATSIQIDFNYYTEVSKDLLLNLGLLEYKVTTSSSPVNSNYTYHTLLWSSNRSLFGFKTYIFIVLILLIFIPLHFIIKNYIFIILCLLSVILIKALALDFYKKHFKLFYGKGGEENSALAVLAALIEEICNNKYKILKHLFMIWIISVIMTSTFRHCVFYLTTLLNLDNDSFISIIIIVSLPFPIFFYLLNFFMKYLNKIKIEEEDYYLYNDYVVGKVNLYRLIYSISICYLIRNYFSRAITIITIGLIALSIILLIICILYALHIYNKASQPSTIAARTVINKHEPLALKAAFEPTAAYICAFIAITPFLQEGCNKGFMDYYLNTGKTKYYDWKHVFFRTPGVIKKGSTVNFMENRKMEELYGVNNSSRENLIRDYRPSLDKSPIINMTWKLKYNEGIQRSQDKFTVRPINYFTNPKFTGAVSLVLKGRFLIVNIIRHDSPGCVFIPSYYLPDQDPNSHTKIRDTVNLLESKYNIVIPWDNNRNNGLVIFTQAESIDNKSLFRVWRPSVNFTEPELKTVNSYYKVKSKDMLRLRQFDYSIKPAEIIKQTVEVQDKALDILERNNILMQKQNKAAHRLAYNEYGADKHYKRLVEFYITKGKKANPYNFLVLDLDRTDKHTLKFKDLLNKAKSETISSIKSDLSKNRRNVKDLLEIVDGKYNRFKSNNEYADYIGHYFKTRRDYPIDSLLLTRDKSHMTYFSIYKNGVIEGYKEKQQLLGDLDSSFILPLVDSRIELINKIASKLTNSAYTNLNLKNIYGVSINRLTFEFFEIRPTSDIWGVFDKGYLGTAAYPEQSMFRHNNNIPDCEVYSIIDLQNNSVKLPALLKENERHYLTIPKHDYNLFDNEDELSIRKFMDFIYTTSDGYLAYESHKDNFSVVKQKSVGFSKKAVDFKNKESKGVKFTHDAFNRRLERGKAIRPKYEPEPGKAFDLMPDEYNEIALIGQRATFNYEPEPRVIEQGVTSFGEAAAKPPTAVSKVNTLPESNANTLDKSKSSKANTLDKSKSSKAKTLDKFKSSKAKSQADSRRPTKSKSGAFKNKGGGSNTMTMTLEATTQDMPVLRLIGAGNITEDSQSSKESALRSPKKSPWLEDEDIYGYSGDEGGDSPDNTPNNSAEGRLRSPNQQALTSFGSATVQAMGPETIMPSIEYQPRELALDDAASYPWSDEPAIPLDEGGPSPDNTPNNSAEGRLRSPNNQARDSNDNFNEWSNFVQEGNDIFPNEAPSDDSPSDDSIPGPAPASSNPLSAEVIVIPDDTPSDGSIPGDSPISAPAQANPGPAPASSNPLPPGYGQILHIPTDTLLVTRHRFSGLPPYFLGVRDGYYYVLITEYTDNSTFPRDIILPANDIEDSVVTAYLPENMYSIDISPDNEGIFEAVSVGNRMDQELPSWFTAEYIASRVIGEDSSHLDNPDGGASLVEDDTNSVDGLGDEAAAHYPDMSDLRREESVYPDSFLPFDPNGYSSEYMDYYNTVDMEGDGELEALNLQARDEGIISNSQEEASPTPGETLEPNILIPEPMEIDADLVREVMMNANGQAAIGTIDPALLLIPTQGPPASIETIDPLPPESEGAMQASNMEHDIEDSSHLDNPDGGASLVEDDTNSVDGLGGEAAAHYPDMSDPIREESVYSDSFLPFDPCGYSSEYMGYGYHGDMVRRCELEALNLQARDEDMAQALTSFGVPSPLSVDTEGQALPIINTSYLSGDSADYRSRAEVSMAAGEEPMEIDADLVREVMMNANGQAVIETIDPLLLLPSQASIPNFVQEPPVDGEYSPLSDIGDNELFELEQEVLNRNASRDIDASMDIDALADAEYSPLSDIGDSGLFELEQYLNQNASGDIDAPGDEEGIYRIITTQRGSYAIPLVHLSNINYPSPGLETNNDQVGSSNGEIIHRRIRVVEEDQGEGYILAIYYWNANRSLRATRIPSRQNEVAPPMDSSEGAS